jgi:flavin reductase (DIM6/NTAB) family NADH-FMN oxidoreductase RutF
MGLFPTGVTVVAARGTADAPVGLTVNSLTSLSLDPPLLLVCIDRKASCHDRLIDAGSFAVSILSSDQVHVARRFAEGRPEVRFHGVAWRPGVTGDPVVEGSTGWVSCTLESVYEGGDHSILVGRVADSGVGEGEALTFYRGEFGTVGT